MKYVFVDFRISSKEKLTLETLGYKVLLCPPSNNLYDAVCGHPDMLIHVFSNNKIIVHRDMSKHFINLLEGIGLEVHTSCYSLKDKYPDDIFLNALNLKNYFIHKLSNTDKILLDFMKNKINIDVKQGYTKCSTAVITNEAIITSDKSIAKALIKENIDVLLLPPGDILLPGLDYGFIGGTCGILDHNNIAFYGDLNHYRYGCEVMDFLYKHNMNPIFLREGKLIDRGSIFFYENSTKES